MKTFVAAVLLFISTFASAATYTLTYTATDPTVTGPAYVASPKVWYRVNGGSDVVVTNAATSGAGAVTASQSLTANPGDLVEVRTQNCNVVSTPVCTALSTYIPAYAPTIPLGFTSQSIVIQ